MQRGKELKKKKKKINGAFMGEKKKGWSQGPGGDAESAPLTTAPRKRGKKGRSAGGKGRGPRVKQGSPRNVKVSKLVQG